MAVFHVKNKATGKLMAEAGAPYTYPTYESAQESAQEWDKSLYAHSFDYVPNNFQVVTELRIGEIVDALTSLARYNAGSEIEWSLFSIVDNLKSGHYSE